MNSTAKDLVKRLIEGVDDIDPKDMLLGFYTKPIYVYRGLGKHKKDIQWTGCYYEGQFIGKYRYNPDDEHIGPMGGWEVVPEGGHWITYVVRSEAEAIAKIKKVMRVREPKRRVRENADDFDPKEMAMSLRYQLHRQEPDAGDIELYNVSGVDGLHIGRIALEDHSKRPAYVSDREWMQPKWQQYQQSPWAAYPRYRDTVVYFKSREAAAEYILKTAGIVEGLDDPDDVIGRNAKKLRLQTTDFKAVRNGTVLWDEYDEASPESDPPFIRYYRNIQYPGVDSLNWNVDLEWDPQIGIRAVVYYGYIHDDGDWRELNDGLEGGLTPEQAADAQKVLDADVDKFLAKLSKFVLISKIFRP